jgi:hypothetical protein
MVAAGLEATLAAANADGHFFANSGRDFIWVKNGSTSSKNVIIDSPVACNQGAAHDVTVAVSPAEERLIGPFPQSRFNDAAGRVNMTFSAVTQLTIAVIRMP